MGVNAVLDMLGTKASRNAHVVGSVFLEKTVMKNVHFLRMAVTVSPYAHVAIIIVTMCLGVNVQYQI